MVLYPIIIQTEKDAKKVLGSIDVELYFAQNYINGQSYYLCGYLTKSGESAVYWQENLLQQPNGKSIVLARSCNNPGIQEKQIATALIDVGFHGPFMIEFIKSNGLFYFIEINPRFWGPLQLGLDFDSRFLNLYLKDQFGKMVMDFSKAEETKYYSWYFGAKNKPLKKYPGVDSVNNLEETMLANDVYNRYDTLDLRYTY